MKKLQFSYQMKLSFSEEAFSNYFTLHALPSEGHGQHVEELSYAVSPSDYLSKGLDGLDNSYLYGAVLAPHSSLSVEVHGTVMTGISRSEEEDRTLQYLYRRETHLTKAGKLIHQLSDKVEHAEDAVRYAMRCCTVIKEVLPYTKGITGSETTAEEALERQGGVCQDYAHVLLSLLRLKGIPARYAAGLVVGEGETHAWVEILSPSGWVGIDPTYSSLVDDHYIVFSTGADAKDCLVNKGVVRLNGTQSLEAKAKTEIVEQ